MKNVLKLISTAILSAICGTTNAMPTDADARQQKEDFADSIILKQFVYNESAFRFQPWKFRRATEDSRIGLGEVLSKVFDIDKSNVISMGISNYNLLSDETHTVLTNKEAIWNFDLFACVLKKQKDGHYIAPVFYSTSLFIKTTVGNYVVSLTGYSGDDTEKYLRCSVMAMDSNNNGVQYSTNLSSSKYASKTRVHSFILAYSEPSDGSSLAQYDKILESMHQKHEANEPLDEVETQLVKGMYEFSYSYYIDYGEWLLSQNRYYDAYTQLHRAYTFLRNEYFKDEQRLEAYQKVCSELFLCLGQMKRYDEASFFLRESVGKDNKQFDVLNTKMADDAPTPKGANNSITIGYALDLLFGVQEKNIASDVAVYDFESSSFITTKILNGKRMKDIVLNSDEARNKVFLLTRSFAESLTHDEEDQSILCYNAPLILATKDVKDDAGHQLTRVETMASNFESNDEKREPTEENVPEHYSFVVGQNGVRTFANSAKEGDKVMAYLEELQKSNRQIERCKLSKEYYNFLSAQIKKDGAEEISKFDAWMSDLNYTIGWTLADLGKQEKAEHYLFMACSSNLYTERVQEYVNCLTGLRSCKTLDYIDWALANSPKPDNEEFKEFWESHMAFLKRRKAYTLIDINRLDEAKVLLTEMLDDPLCHDFAVRELNYIESLNQQ